MIRRLYDILSSPALSLVLRLFLGAMFLYAGSVKMIDPAGFAKAVANYQILPGYLASIVAVVLPPTEILVALSLLLGWWIKGGAFLATGLQGIFSVALVLSLIRGLNIDCGCFSTSPGVGTITWTYLIRDYLLMAGSLQILFFDSRYGSIGRSFRLK
ncbi:MAG: MauE/DoxX family redox-associated membrane protein [Syntrophales bacterium]